MSPIAQASLNPPDSKGVLKKRDLPLYHRYSQTLKNPLSSSNNTYTNRNPQYSNGTMDAPHKFEHSFAIFKSTAIHHSYLATLTTYSPTSTHPSPLHPNPLTVIFLPESPKNEKRSLFATFSEKRENVIKILRAFGNVDLAPPDSGGDVCKSAETRPRI
jgi:hypothetical protein